MYYILKLEHDIYVYMPVEHVSPIEVMETGGGLQLGGSNGKSSLIQAIKGLGVPRGLLLNVSKPTYLSSAARPASHTFIDGDMIDSLFGKMSATLHTSSHNDTSEDNDKALPKLNSKPKSTPKPLHNKNRKTKRALPPLKMSASLNKKRNTRKRNTRGRNT